MNVLEHLAGSKPDMSVLDYDRLDKACERLYDRYLRTCRDQYIRCVTPTKTAFLSLQWPGVAVLEQDLGSLVRIQAQNNPENRRNGMYAVVTGYTMSSAGHVFLKCRTADDEEVALTFGDYAQADIPKQILDLAKAMVRRDAEKGGAKEAYYD